MTHTDYLDHIQKHLNDALNDNEFSKFLQAHKEIFIIMVNLNLDAASDILKPLYCPVKRSKPRDPVCMLRSLILMTLLKIPSITKWVEQTRTHSLLAILAGFNPDDTPGIGTYYDFMKRIIDGPYQKPCPHVTKRSTFNSGSHKRNIKQEKEEKKNSFDPHHSQSAQLVEKLLDNADSPRANDFNKILEDLLIQIGLIPTIEQELLTELNDLIISGDGSILVSNASSEGKPTCSCRSEGNYDCNHPRLYSSPTAVWCYDHHHDCFLFGDRYYHLVVNQNGHDFPIHTIMPGGNESDYTLSLKAFDRFLKAAAENGLTITIVYFCGDGHHDSYAHYHYFQEKNVIPIIPLTHSAKKTFIHLDNSDIVLAQDGTPLCPGGMKMRHHLYNKTKKVHVYCCPVKRNTHRDGKSLYVAHTSECPKDDLCCPESSLAPLIYIKSDTDCRLFPPLDRNSLKFKEIMNQRSASERCNFINDTYHLDHSCRNADYGLIRLTLANIVEHAAIRNREAVKNSSENELFEQALNKVGTHQQPTIIDAIRDTSKKVKKLFHQTLNKVGIYHQNKNVA